MWASGFTGTGTGCRISGIVCVWAGGIGLNVEPELFAKGG